ncbi:MAG: twin-arginine translocase subunit TatB [Duodenibacillus sp.]|nr:twin-arginine translocase subunit TatB [Duodenibacillus sp.]
MFDFGFSELMVIGAVGLVVLGPERLPTVAKMAGQWMGKAQRMVNQVKSDFERESSLSELKKIQQEAKSAVEDFEKAVKHEATDMEQQFESVRHGIDQAMGKAEGEAKDALDEARASLADTQKFLDEQSAAIEKGLKGTAGSADAAPAAGDGKDSLAEHKHVGSGDPTEDFYDWYEDATENDEQGEAGYDTCALTFDKRYRPGPTIDELVQQIEKLNRDVGDRAPRMGGQNRRYAVRARTNRVRIYR